MNEIGTDICSENFSFAFFSKFKYLNHSFHCIGIDIRHPRKKNCWPRKLDSHWHKFQIGSKIDDNAIELAYHSRDLISKFQSNFAIVPFPFSKRKFRNILTDFWKRNTVIPTKTDFLFYVTEKNQPIIRNKKVLFDECAKWNTCFHH